MIDASIFEKVTAKLFATYRCDISMRNKIMGGIPKDPKVIEAWIRSKAGVKDDEEVRQMMLRTLVELGAEVTPDMTYTELVDASEKLAEVKQTNGFKQDETGLYIESRQVKAMLKESFNVLFPYTDPDTKDKEQRKTNAAKWHQKSARNFISETVFINPEAVHLGVKEPTNVEFMIIHAKTAKGPINSLSYVEYVIDAKFSFNVMVTNDWVKDADWPKIWAHAQENGLGASRSQGYGRFNVTKWEKVST